LRETKSPIAIAIERINKNGKNQEWRATGASHLYLSLLSWKPWQQHWELIQEGCLFGFSAVQASNLRQKCLRLAYSIRILKSTLEPMPGEN
jgi:hypothetical protein